MNTRWVDTTVTSQSLPDIVRKALQYRSGANVSSNVNVSLLQIGHNIVVPSTQNRGEQAHSEIEVIAAFIISSSGNSHDQQKARKTWEDICSIKDEDNRYDAQLNFLKKFNEHHDKQKPVTLYTDRPCCENCQRMLRNILGENINILFIVPEKGEDDKEEIMQHIRKTLTDDEKQKYANTPLAPNALKDFIGERYNNKRKQVVTKQLENILSNKSRCDKNRSNNKPIPSADKLDPIHFSDVYHSIREGKQKKQKSQQHEKISKSPLKASSSSSSSSKPSSISNTATSMATATNSSNFPTHRQQEIQDIFQKLKLDLPNPLNSFWQFLEAHPSYQKSIYEGERTKTPNYDKQEAASKINSIIDEFKNQFAIQSSVDAPKVAGSGFDTSSLYHEDNPLNEDPSDGNSSSFSVAPSTIKSSITTSSTVVTSSEVDMSSSSPSKPASSNAPSNSNADSIASSTNLQGSSSSSSTESQDKKKKKKKGKDKENKPATPSTTSASPSASTSSTTTTTAASTSTSSPQTTASNSKYSGEEAQRYRRFCTQIEDGSYDMDKLAEKAEYDCQKQNVLQKKVKSCNLLNNKYVLYTAVLDDHYAFVEKYLKEKSHMDPVARKAKFDIMQETANLKKDTENKKLKLIDINSVKSASSSSQQLKAEEIKGGGGSSSSSSSRGKFSSSSSSTTTSTSTIARSLGVGLTVSPAEILSCPAGGTTQQQERPTSSNAESTSSIRTTGTSTVTTTTTIQAISSSPSASTSSNSGGIKPRH